VKLYFTCHNKNIWGTNKRSRLIPESEGAIWLSPGLNAAFAMKKLEKLREVTNTIHG
jgi:hypothetical protein